MPSAKLTSKGQLTVPKEVRRLLGLRTGDHVAFNVQDDGTVSVEAEKRSLVRLRGLLRPKVGGVTIEDMNAAIRKGWSGQ